MAGSFVPAVFAACVGGLFSGADSCVGAVGLGSAFVSSLGFTLASPTAGATGTVGATGAVDAGTVVSGFTSGTAATVDAGTVETDSGVAGTAGTLGATGAT